MAPRKQPAKKRPLDSGRTDTAGRRVKVSGDVAVNRAEAPAPDEDDEIGSQLALIDDTAADDDVVSGEVVTWDGVATEVRSDLVAALAGVKDWREAEKVRDEANQRYQTVVNTPERADAEMEAAAARIAELDRELKLAQQWKQMAETAKAASMREELTAQYHDAKREQAAAKAKMEQSFNALDLAAAAKAGRSIDDDKLNAHEQLVRDYQTASSAVYRTQSAAQRANNWGFDHPEMRDPDDDGRNDRPRDLPEDQYTMMALYRLAVRPHSPVKGADMAPAIDRVRRYGVGDYGGVPCTNCGGRRNRYNDETYACGSCY